MTIHFPDLSHFKTVSLDGAVALITKATQGLSYVDPTYAVYKRDAEARGIPFAGYHWVDTSDLGGQAAHAFRIMGNTPCMWDAEAAGATVPRLVELTQRYRALGGNPRLVYLPHWWWQDHLGSPSLQPLADLGLALVSSAYPARGYTENGIGWNGYGGVMPRIWQWTDAHPFNGQLVDFNAFKGTVEELRALFNGQSATTPAEEATMFTAQIAGSPSCWVSDGLTYRPVADGLTLQRLAQAGAKHVVVPNADELAKLCGQPQTAAPGGPVSGPVDLTDAAVAKVAGATASELHSRLAG